MRLAADNDFAVEPLSDAAFGELKAWLLRVGQRRGIKSKMASLFEDTDAPAWLDLTSAEKNRAVQHLARVCDEYPATSIDELIWCLAVDAVRPHRRGRKSKWLGLAGVALVHDVDRELQARKSTSRDRKALRQVIADIKREQPERYGRYTAERLRDAYYDAVPRARFFVSA